LNAQTTIPEEMVRNVVRESDTLVALEERLNALVHRMENPTLEEQIVQFIGNN